MIRLYLHAVGATSCTYSMRFDDIGLIDPTYTGGSEIFIIYKMRLKWPHGTVKIKHLSPTFCAKVGGVKGNLQQ